MCRGRGERTHSWHTYINLSRLLCIFFSFCLLFFLFFFVHVGCKNNRWLRRWPVEGRHIQIQGHALPLLQERKRKRQCKLPARPCSPPLLLCCLPTATSFWLWSVSLTLKKQKSALRVELFAHLFRMNNRVYFFHAVHPPEDVFYVYSWNNGELCLEYSNLFNQQRPRGFWKSRGRYFWTGKHNFPRGEFLPKKELLFPIMPFESRFPSVTNPMTCTTSNNCFGVFFWIICHPRLKLQSLFKERIQ